MTKKKKTLELKTGDFPKRFKICHKTRIHRGPVKTKTKCVNFGDRRYDNYTIHKNPKRKKNYVKRHKTREDWGDIESAGFWAKNLLWNKPTLKASIKDVENRKGLRIVRKS